jgi:rubrerythrin
MSLAEPFDPLTRFAEVERLVSKIYFRFSHLFLDRAELRDFWWEMAKEEEQHACILHACKALIENFKEEKLDSSISLAKANELKDQLSSYLARGASSLSVEEAFRIAVEIEGSEIDTIYSKLLRLGGPNIAKTMENLGVPASVQRQKLKASLRSFCSGSPELLQAAESL